MIPARLLVNDVYYAALETFPKLAGALGGGVARGLMSTPRRSRRVLWQNARLALGPDATGVQIRRTVQGMLVNMQTAIAEVLLFQHQDREWLANRVTAFSGQEEYHRARAARCGMIIATAHMGAFEPCLALLRRFEAKIHVLYHPDPMPRFERARSRLRRAIGVVEHRAAEGVAAWSTLEHALRANEVVVLQADRLMPFQRGERIPFLGAPNAVLPTGPARLALACGSAMVPTFCFRRASGMEVQMTEPILNQEEALRAAEVAVHPAQRALVAAMERAIRAQPEQWLAFAPIVEETP
jgi:lauroyl/myristoyl acyltransferase